VSIDLKIVERCRFCWMSILLSTAESLRKLRLCEPPLASCISSPTPSLPLIFLSHDSSMIGRLRDIGARNHPPLLFRIVRERKLTMGVRNKCLMFMRECYRLAIDMRDALGHILLFKVDHYSNQDPSKDPGSLLTFQS